MCAVPKRTEGRREFILVKELWWYVTCSLPVSTAALLSEWPTREPFHCVHVRLWVVGKGERAAYVVVELVP